VHDTPVRAKELASKTGLVFQCCQCESFHVQHLGELEYGGKKARRGEGPTAPATSSTAPAPGDEGSKGPPQLPSKYKVPKAKESIGSNCHECGGRYSIGGPFYLGSLYSKEFIEGCLAVCDAESLEHVTSWKKITGLLTAMSEEIEDIPLHYSLPSLCGLLRLDCMPARQLKGTLQHLGYRVSHFHREPAAIKTDAPNTVVFDILRKWAEHRGKKVGEPATDSAGTGGAPAVGGGSTAQTGPKVGGGEGTTADGAAAVASRSKPKKQKAPDPIAARILEKPIATAQLEGLELEHMNIKDEERPRKVPRFLPNPEKFWGPKARAKPT